MKKEREKNTKNCRATNNIYHDKIQLYIKKKEKEKQETLNDKWLGKHFFISSMRLGKQSGYYCCRRQRMRDSEMRSELQQIPSDST